MAENRLIRKLAALKIESKDKEKNEHDYEEVPKSVISLPKKKLIVLDVNGVLAHSFFKFEGIKVPRDRVADGIIGEKLVFKRPSCDNFLQFCFQSFDVGIWSTAKKRNVEGAISFILGPFKSKVLFVWDQSQCTDTGHKTLEKSSKPLLLKELHKLWNSDSSNLPWSKGYYSPSNTLLIDDSPYKALLNPPNTAIFPNPYKVTDLNDTSLGRGGELRVYLEGLVDANDVQSYVRAQPLGQHAVTAAHPDWQFYSKIIRRRSRSSLK